MSLVTASGTDAAFEELPPELKGFSDEIDRLARSMAGDQAEDDWAIATARRLIVQNLLGKAAFHRQLRDLGATTEQTV